MVEAKQSLHLGEVIVGLEERFLFSRVPVQYSLQETVEAKNCVRFTRRSRHGGIFQNCIQ